MFVCIYIYTDEDSDERLKNNIRLFYLRFTTKTYVEKLGRVRRHMAPQENADHNHCKTHLRQNAGHEPCANDLPV